MLDRHTPRRGWHRRKDKLVGFGCRIPRALVSIAALTLLALPLVGAPSAQAAPALASTTYARADSPTLHDHWMADMGNIGRLQLGQVILPASHDSGTYAFANTLAAGNAPPIYAMDQDIDIYTQLQHGIRVLDLRGRDFEGAAASWDGPLPSLVPQVQQLTRDYYLYHGPATSTVPLAAALDDVARWVQAPGHDKEVVILQVVTEGEKTQRLSDMCSGFKQKIGSVLLDPHTFYNAAQPQAAHPASPAPTVPHFSYTGLDVAQNTLNDVWSLPGHQRVILNWDECGPSWPEGTFNGYWANQCYAQSYNSAAFDRPGIIGALQPALNGRLSALGADGLQGGPGQIATRPSTMPGSSPVYSTSTTGGSVAPGSYAIKYAWLSPLGETRASPVGNAVLPAGSSTNTISFYLPPFPIGVTGAAIYMSSAGDSTVTQQGQTTTLNYIQATPPTTTGQKPTNSDQVGYMRDSYGRTVLNGFYSLGMHATLTADCALPMDWFLPQQAMVLDTVKGWFDSSQNHARDYLNIISADYVERSSVVDYALKMNTPQD